MPVKVLLTTLAGDQMWTGKLLKTVAPTATNGCAECFVPTRPLVEAGERVPRQRYAGYDEGFELTNSMVDTINKVKTQVSMRLLPFTIRMSSYSELVYKCCFVKKVMRGC